MFSLIVFVAAAGSGVINESLASYASVGRGDSTWEVITATASKVWDDLMAGDTYNVFKLILRFIGMTFMLLMPSFADFPTAQPLSDGHVITNGKVAEAGWKIGLLWTGIVAVIGLYFFNKKEIARVQV